MLGVLVSSTLKERVANYNRLNAFAKVGKEISFPNDFNNILFAKPSRTINSVSSANTAINLDKDRLKHSLFWFISGSPIDEIALRHLQAGNRDKADEIFQKKETFASLINLGVLAFIDGDIATGFNNITKVVHSSDLRTELLNALGIANIQLSEEELVELVITVLLAEIPAYKLLSACSNNIDRATIIKRALDEPISAINSAIAVAKNADSKNSDASLAAGTKLMESTKDPLQTVKEIAGESSPQYQMAADNIAQQVLECGISYYNNASEDDLESPRKAMVLQAYALSISVGPLTKKRCKENYDILKREVDELPPLEIAREANHILSNLNRTEITKGKDVENLIIQCEILLGIIKEYDDDAAIGYYEVICTKIARKCLNVIISLTNKALESFNEKMTRESLYGSLGKYDYIVETRTLLEEYYSGVIYLKCLTVSSDAKEWFDGNITSLKNAVSQLGGTIPSVKYQIYTETERFKACISISAYSKYLELYPNGKYRKEAINRIEFLTFKNCVTIADYNKYLDKYPKGQYRKEVVKQIEALEYNDCYTISDYERFIEKHPFSEYAIKATQRIDDLRIEQQERAERIAREQQLERELIRLISQAKSVKEIQNIYPQCFNNRTQELADNKFFSLCKYPSDYKLYLNCIKNPIHKQPAYQKTENQYLPYILMASTIVGWLIGYVSEGITLAVFGAAIGIILGIAINITYKLKR